VVVSLPSDPSASRQRARSRWRCRIAISRQVVEGAGEGPLPAHRARASQKHACRCSPGTAQASRSTHRRASPATTGPGWSGDCAIVRGRRSPSERHLRQPLPTLVNRGSMTASGRSATADWTLGAPGVRKGAVSDPKRSTPSRTWAAATQTTPDIRTRSVLRNVVAQHWPAGSTDDDGHPAGARPQVCDAPPSYKSSQRGDFYPDTCGVRMT